MKTWEPFTYFSGVDSNEQVMAKVLGGQAQFGALFGKSQLQKLGLLS